MKKTVIRMLCLCSILFFTGNVLQASAAESLSEGTPKEHSGKTWGEIKTIDYDFDTIAGHISEMEQLAEEGTASGQADREQEVLELHRRFLEDAALLDTCYGVAHVLYYCDVQNEELAEREKEIYMEYVDLSDGMSSAMDAILSSPYQEILSTVMNSRQQEEFMGYEELTEDEKEMIRQESELTQKYDRISAQEFSVTIDGKEWNYENLMTAEVDYGTFLQTYRELGRVRNEALSGVYLELAELRSRLAASFGYDNYLDYAMEEVYERDYTAEEVRGLFEEVKESAVPLYGKLSRLYEEVDWEEMMTVNTDGEAILDALEPYMAEMDDDLYQSFLYMRKYGLYDIAKDAEKGEGGFTFGLPWFGEAFIYNKPEGSYQDYTAIIHEFGHFYSEFAKQEPALYENSNLDIQEIHSTGLEVLFGQYHQGIFGKSTGRLFSLLQILNILQNAILYQSMISEFEMEIYQKQDMTVQDMNRLYAKLEREYGLALGYGQGNGEYQESYGWVDITHIYHSPLYCISYVTSGLSALDLYTWAGKDREAAVDGYMKLTSLSGDMGYQEVISQSGLSDIFKQGAVESILTETLGLQPDLEEAWNKPEVGGRYGIYYYLAGAALAYLVLSSFTGIGTGLFLLLRQRNRKRR